MHITTLGIDLAKSAFQLHGRHVYANLLSQQKCNPELPCEV